MHLLGRLQHGEYTHDCADLDPAIIEQYYGVVEEGDEVDDGPEMKILIMNHLIVQVDQMLMKRALQSLATLVQNLTERIIWKAFICHLSPDSCH